MAASPLKCGKSGPCAAAFTLMELLVVMSTVMLLVALAAPTFSAARATARTTVCGSNLHQLALANLVYALENRDHYVLAAEDIWQPIERGWGGQLGWFGPDSNRLFDLK